ncbi:MAG: SDR family NAD(P)-dependent oxidoreductase [Candidatus Binatia bacterium]
MLHPEIEQLFSLAGKVAVVTGGATGIGRGCARRLAQAGADIVVADRDGAGAERVAGELIGFGRRAVAVVVDVVDEAAVASMADRAVQALGGLDILVNNAGIFPSSRIADMTVEEWDRVMAVNLRGVFLCTREAVRVMRARGRGGRVVNVSSIESFHPSFAGLAHYNTSKSGVNLFTKSAALEFARSGVTVNAVCPGATLTEGTAAAFNSGLQAALEPRIPLRRVATPEEIGAAVLFLASPAASYVTGTTLVVDGGYLVT